MRHARTRPGLYVATTDGHDDTAQVRAAIEAGAPTDVGALVQATGLPPRAVKVALARLR